MNILRKRIDTLALDKGVEAAEKIALSMKEVLAWILVALFTFTVGTMIVKVFWQLFRGELLSAAQIVATLGTVMVLTLVADGFKIVSQDLKEVQTVSTVLKMAMIGVVANMFFNLRLLGDPNLLEFLHGFASFAIILTVSALSYLILERSIQN